ncbi:MAG: hypothetical protein AB1665_06260 [Candidatus Thermoplasmatota archaeon]
MRKHGFVLCAIATMMLAMMGISGAVMGAPAASTATMTIVLDTEHSQLTIQFVGEQDWDLSREFKFVPKGIVLQEQGDTGVYWGECEVTMIAPGGEEVYIVVPKGGAGNAEDIMKVRYTGELPVSLVNEQTMLIGPVSVIIGEPNQDQPDALPPIVIDKRPNQDDPT